MKMSTFTVNKANVYDEVAKTTGYTGFKMIQADNAAYDRIFTTDEDRMMLERFWIEACNIVTEQFKPFLVTVSAQPESHGVELDRNYEVQLELSSSYDETLSDSISSSLFSVFVSTIVSKWFKFTNKEESGNYALEAASMLDSIMRKLYFRKKPQRVNPMQQ